MIQHALAVAAAAVLLGWVVAWRVAPEAAHGLLAGGAWNLTSLWCLSRLLEAWLGPQPSRRRVVMWLLVKFPLLYLAAFGLLFSGAVSPVGFGAGFTVVLVVVMGWGAVRIPRALAGRAHGR